MMVSDRRDATAPLDERIADVVGSLNVLHGELVALLAEAVSTDEWSGGPTAVSLRRWVCWQTGCSPSTATQLVELVAARDTHPRLSALLTAGELTVDQAAAAVKVRPESDETMATLAPMSTVTQIRTEVRVANHSPQPPEPTGPDDEAEPDNEAELDNGAELGDGRPGAPAGGAAADGCADDGEFVAQGITDGDLWWLSANLTGERGALVKAALEEAHDRLRRDGHRNVSWADALVDIAARSLLQLSDNRLNLYRVNVHIPIDQPVAATLADRTTLPECIAKQLTCDGWISPVFTGNGRPTAVGRSERVVPERTRRIVMHRDGGMCTNPLCGSTFGLEVHHIVHWEHGGLTDPDNLVTLCGSCHRAHHRGRLGITGNADTPGGVIFTDHDGQPFRRPKPNPPPTLPTPPVQRYRHPVGERLDTWTLSAIFHQPSTN